MKYRVHCVRTLTQEGFLEVEADNEIKALCAADLMLDRGAQVDWTTFESEQESRLAEPLEEP